jgi:hypothetical protein
MDVLTTNISEKKTKKMPSSSGAAVGGGSGVLRPRMNLYPISSTDKQILKYVNPDCKALKLEGFYIYDQRNTKFNKEHGFVDTPKEHIMKKWPRKKEFLQKLCMIETLVTRDKTLSGHRFTRGPWSGRGPSPDRLSSEFIGATDILDKQECINWSNVYGYLKQHDVVPSAEFIDYIDRLYDELKVETRTLSEADLGKRWKGTSNIYVDITYKSGVFSSQPVGDILDKLDENHKYTPERKNDIIIEILEETDTKKTTRSFPSWTVYKKRLLEIIQKRKLEDLPRVSLKSLCKSK